MTDWAVFGGLVAVALTALLLLSRASARTFHDEYRPDESDGRADGSEDRPDGPEHRSDESSDETEEPVAPSAEPTEFGPSPEAAADVGEHAALRDESAMDLLASVALSQALFGGLVLGAALLTAVPAEALGVGEVGVSTLAVGVAVGLVVFLANRGGERLAERVGLDLRAPNGLRAALAPTTRAEWVVLLGVTLPVIAGVEELLFRAVLVGAASVGFGVSPWVLVVPAAAAFALGHSAQGRLGVVVTGLLGLVFGATFVHTGSLAAVVVAHYLANALEFVVGGE